MNATSIDMTPTWEQAMGLLAVILENGTNEGKAMAREELRRAGLLLDGLAAEAKGTEAILQAAMRRRVEQNGRTSHGY